MANKIKAAKHLDRVGITSIEMVPDDCLGKDTKRNRLIVSEVLAGKNLKDIAARAGISSTQVTVICFYVAKRYGIQNNHFIEMLPGHARRAMAKCGYDPSEAKSRDEFVKICSDFYHWANESILITHPIFGDRGYERRWRSLPSMYAERINQIRKVAGIPKPEKTKMVCGYKVPLSAYDEIRALARLKSVS